MKDALKEALHNDEDESIVRLERNAGDGTFDVQFAKVWEARGCATLLDGNENDVKDELVRSLQGGVESDADGVGIVDVQRWNDGRIFVKFSKVWDARGCEFVLDGTKQLFGGSAIGVACVLENDLPDTLKISEARKRDAASAARKVAKASKLAMEIEEI